MPITTLLISLLLLTRVGSEFHSDHLAAIPRDCYTFTIDNASSDTLGEVVVTGTADFADFNITGTGFFQQNICFAAVSVTINNVVILYPNSGDVQLPNGAWVKAGWQSPSLVEVALDTRQNTPQQ